MRKFIKYLSMMLVLIILIMSALAIGLRYFVDPNRLKPYIAAQVKQSTGRQLTMDGSLSWSFFPSFGIELGHATLSNPPGFGGAYFAQVKKVTIGVKLLPLLHKRFESDGLKVDGLVLNFVKNERGEENWQQWKNDSHPSVDTSQHQSTETGKSIASVLSSRKSVGLILPARERESGKRNWERYLIV